MAGGKNKIHEHPNAGTSTFRERPGDINKKGKPKGTHDFATLLQMALKERGIEEETRYILAREYIDIILNKELKTADRLKALDEILDRLEGTVTQKVEMTETKPIIQVKDKESLEALEKMEDM